MSFFNNSLSIRYYLLIEHHRKKFSNSNVSFLNYRDLEKIWSHFVFLYWAFLPLREIDEWRREWTSRWKCFHFWHSVFLSSERNPFKTLFITTALLLPGNWAQIWGSFLAKPLPPSETSEECMSLWRKLKSFKKEKHRTCSTLT